MSAPQDQWPRDFYQAAFDETVAAFAVDMPLLMHGSGDVAPSQVRADTVQLLSALTAQYVAHLVEAALGAHQDLLLPNEPRPAGGLLPPPAFPKSRQPPRPPPSQPISPFGAGDHESSLSTKKRPRRHDDEFWDEPLPEPKIRGKDVPISSSSSSTTTTTTRIDSTPRNFWDALPSGTSGEEMNHDDDPNEENDLAVPADEWVGLAGVDFMESQTRAAFVQSPAALSPASFMFPICHDVYLYGRVTEVQAAQRSTMGPILVDPTWMDLIRTEGRRRPRRRRRSRSLAAKGSSAPSKKAKGDSAKKGKDASADPGSDPDDDDNNNNNNNNNSNNQDDEEDDEDVAAEPPSDDEGGGGPVWPGIEGLIPVHRYL